MEKMCTGLLVLGIEAFLFLLTHKSHLGIAGFTTAAIHQARFDPFSSAFSISLTGINL